MDTVFSIRNEFNEGPYCGQGKCPGPWMDTGHYDGFNHPSPGEDFGEQWYSIKNANSDWIPDKLIQFGFRSLAQLKAWFSETERERLALKGYKVHKFKVEKILLESDYQVIYYRRLRTTPKFSNI